jgi:polysaccharide biosynthesis protein VpsM
MSVKHRLFVAGSCLALLSATNVHGIDINPMTVVAAADTPVINDIPMGQPLEGEETLLPEEGEDELFGAEGGYFHPYITLAGEWTDNLYNISEGADPRLQSKKSNFLTRISPGMWLSLPRTKVIPVTITPHNSSAGGLQHQLKDHSGTDRYQVYALGGVDFLNYSEDSDLNSTDGNIEGLARYNMRGGLSLQILDRYSVGHDRFEVGNFLVEPLREFESNIFMATADWLVTEKVRLKADYSMFDLSYDDEINEYMNRGDNVVDLYAYYVYSEKTSLFLQYSLMDVSYDDVSLRDNSQDYLYGGIRWDTTEKLSILLKVGYQQKEYDELRADSTDYDDLALDLQTTYRFKERAELVLDVYQKNEESDSAVALDKEVLGARLGYVQEYTDKITGKLDFIYEDADYRQLIAQDRDDVRFVIRPAIQYLFKKWLMGELAYSYDDRDSSDDLFDYDTNTFMANINFAL